MSLERCFSTAFTPPPILLNHQGRGENATLATGRRGLLQTTAPVSDTLFLASRTSNLSASTTSFIELQVQASIKTDNERSAAEIEIAKRLQFLRVEAERDQISFSESSLADFQAFMHDLRPRSRPYLFLNDNGNLRALWRNDRREQVALEFLGDRTIQFVIFKQRRGAATMSRVAGIDTMDAIRQLIKAIGAEGLLAV